MMVVEPKMVQPVDLDEKPVGLSWSTYRIVQKPYLYSITFFQSVKVEPQLVEVRSRDGWGSTVTYQALNANG